jgi:hypothetical protein
LLGKANFARPVFVCRFLAGPWINSGRSNSFKGGKVKREEATEIKREVVLTVDDVRSLVNVLMKCDQATSNNEKLRAQNGHKLSIT